jgi:16S rRNA U516 pseudouridylate synthase RsuA-like enzyme
VVSKEDKHNKTIFELLPNSWKKDFYYIGRLDKDSH